MPGNEVADKVHNFFEQDESQGHHQLQVARGNWPVLNNNPWVGNQRQNGAPLNSNLKNYNLQSSESERGNGWQSSRMPYGTDLSHLTLRPEFSKSQPRTQQLSFNGFMHSPQGSQTRPNQMELLGEDPVPERHNLTSRGLAVIESQQGNAPECSPVLTRNSEGFEAAESPVNFDFLGGQQPLMRNQQQGGPPPRPRQQSGLNVSDMQLWQQHFVYKQLQELQRQQQLQQQSSLGQLSAITKQPSGDQLPALVNGAPIHDSSNYIWPGDFMGGDNKIPSSSQMFTVGNMNRVHRVGSPAMQGYPNGLMLSQDQSQAFRSMGFVPQQPDQTLYGAPVASTRGTLNLYSQFQGIPQDGSDMLTKAGGNEAEKLIMQSTAFNSFQNDQSAVFPNQGKNLFGHVPIQTLNNGALSGNFQQLNPLPRNVPPTQEFHGGQEEAGWGGSLQEKAATQVGSSHGMVNLDPTEEKILFNDDGMWDSSFGRSGGMSTMEGTDYLNVFPSVQSGSWSALMQSAVAEASSSDNGLQDEWSGLSFQKPTADDGKQTTCVDNSLQITSSLTSRPFPLFDDANMSPSGHSIPGFQQPTKFSYEQSERESLGPSHDALHQSPKETCKWLDQNSQQNPVLEGTLQVQAPFHLGNASAGPWGNQMYEQSRSATHSDIELNLQNMQGSWAPQQSLPSYNISDQSCNKLNGWNMNESLPPIGDATLKISDNETTVQHAQSMHMERDRDGGITGMWKATDNRVSVSFPNSTGGIERVKSGVGSPQVNTEESYMSNFAALQNSSNSKNNQEINQQFLNNHQIDYGKRAIIDSSMKYSGSENVGNYQNHLGKGQAQESSMNNYDRVSGETYDKKWESSFRKEISNDSNISGQRTGGSTRENAWSGANDSHTSISGNQKSAGQAGRKSSGARRFQYHPMGNLVVNAEASDTTKHFTHSQGLSQPVTRVPKGQEQGYFGQSKLFGHSVSNNAMDMEKGCLPDSKRNGKGAEDAPSRSIHSGHEPTVSASFDGSAAFYAPKRTGQASQNMLELLHKVDQSRENNTVAHIGSSEQTLSEIPIGATSDASVAHVHRSYSSASQGFGLRLAPPSERLSISNHALSSQTTSQTVDDLNSRHIDPEVGDRGQAWLTTASLQSLPPDREVSQSEYWDNKSSISGQIGNENPPLNVAGNFLASVTSRVPHQRDQRPEHLSSASGQVANDHSTNLSFANRADLNTHSKFASHFIQSHESHDGAPADQSSHASLSSRIMPFNLRPHAESCVGIASPHSYSSEPARSQPINVTSSYQRVSGQQQSSMEPVPVPQSPITSGVSQQGAFSTMLHNVWTNISAKQRVSGGPPHQVPPNMFPSMGPSNSTLEATSWAPQRVDGQGMKNGGNSASEFGTCTINSQHLTYGEEQQGKDSSIQKIPSERVDLAPQMDVASQGKETEAQRLSDRNSASSNSLAVHPHQQDLGRGKHGQEPSLVSQTEHVSVQSAATSNQDIEAFGRSLKPSNVLNQNYALLNQIQVMKDAETDPSRKSGKRLKGAESGVDAQQTVGKTGQRFGYGYSSMTRDPVDNEPSAAARHFPSTDAKMLCFSLEGKDDKNANKLSVHIEDVPSQDMVTFGRKDSSHRTTESTPSSRGTERADINPQMAPSWFEQYGTYKNGQILAMYDGLDSSRRTAKVAAQQFFFGKASSETLHTHSPVEQTNAGDASQVGSAWQTLTNTVVASEYFSSPQSLPPDVIDQNLAVVRPKKRKNVAPELVPWHKEVTQGSQMLQNISMAELDWAQAANRRIEKVEDEADVIEDGPPMPRPLRRLILTTQLMQQLFRSVPASILSAEATSEYESVVYFGAKLALGDACGTLVSFPESDSRVHPNNRNMTSEKLKDSERLGDQFIAKVVEDFSGRARKLENDLSRLDKRASILDIRVECQELERYSIINRFGRIHARGTTDGVQGSSSSKTFHKKYVNALPMPRNLPEGVLCLSL
ncbi:uncharacterized protein LOC143856726 [Tasmannia lanceolata]|uniref:uncharacterized protein LOC143856726 n=1 Tax=Tasmannia lanceolata TaxID=3420 RepID=UPI0040641888